MYKQILKQIWPEWELGKRLGGGAFGTVYEAIRNEYDIENKAAIKIISISAKESEKNDSQSADKGGNDEQSRFKAITKDFVNEIQLMVSLSGSNNIVFIKDYKVVRKTEENGYYIFILMELLTPFPDYVRAVKPDEKAIIKLGCDICNALEICAKENIIHRDIKPGNILVDTKTGTFKLGDFGIARKLENTAEGLSKKFTPKYMAPEIKFSKNYDERVDIYSLGIVLYEMLNQYRIPFQKNMNANYHADIEEAVQMRNSGIPVPPPCNASPAMADVILRAVAFNPDERFRSAEEFRQALLSVQNGTYQPVRHEQQINPEPPTPPAIQQVPPNIAGNIPPVYNYNNFSHNVDNFAPAPQKKKFPVGILLIILALIIIAILLVCIFTIFLSDDNNSDNSKEDSSISSELSYDEENAELINQVIADAESLAADNNLYEAFRMINNAIKYHPDSEVLKEKADEYLAMMEAEDNAEKHVADTTEASAATAPTTAPITEPTTEKPAAQTIADFKSAVKDVYASSQLVSQSYGNQVYSYDPQKALDNNHSTCWCEGKSDYGSGEFITIHFDKIYTIKEITLWNGLCTSEDLFNKNSRPRNITIMLSEGEEFSFECKDGWDNRKNVFTLPVSAETSSVTVKILSVYEGSKYSDTCISEISVS